MFDQAGIGQIGKPLHASHLPWHAHPIATTSDPAALPSPLCAGRAPKVETGTPLWWRIMAVRLYCWCQGDVSKAGTEMRKLHPRPLPSRIREHINRWQQRFMDTGDVRDAPRDGAPRKVPLNRARELAARLKRGVEDGGVFHHHFGSFEEACEADPEFELAMDEFGCTRRTLLEALKEADPDLKWGSEEVKWAFSPLEKALRVECADYMLKMVEQHGVEWLDTIFFVDEASVWVNPYTNRMVWCSKHGDRPMVITDEPHKKYKLHAKWYLAVNSKLGVLGPYFTTGTTEQPHAFPVSRCSPRG